MKAKDFNGKICVITGAGSGIGRALAVSLAEAGAKLALSDINGEGLDQTKEMLSGAELMTDILDVADKDAIAAYPARVAAGLGAADYVFNVAGLTRIGNFVDTPLESMEKIMDVNYWGVVRMSKAFIEQLLATKGTLVNISSLFGFIAYSGQAHYCASKFAVRGFTETLALELAGSGVKVCCVHPGGVKTDIARNAIADHLSNDGPTREEMDDGFDKLAITTAEKAADIILTGAGRGQKRIVVGPDAKLASFLQRMMPVKYQTLLGLYARENALAPAAKR
jgi:NAD(P)-dependent dehydrogenase (short-subunit alcohol dehydrogenase family)